MTCTNKECSEEERKDCGRLKEIKLFCRDYKPRFKFCLFCFFRSPAKDYPPPKGGIGGHHTNNLYCFWCKREYEE